MKNLKVVMNLTGLSELETIHRGRFYVQNVNNNPLQLADCVSVTAQITTAANDAQTAVDDAADKAVTKVALMGDKISDLVLWMNLYGATVERTCKGDETIVHLAGLEVKKTGVKNIPDFNAIPTGDSGAIMLRVRARDRGTTYKWQYCKDPLADNTWQEAGYSKESKTTVTGLTPGIYWFKVTFIDGNGEHPQTPVSFAIN